MYRLLAIAALALLFTSVSAQEDKPKYDARPDYLIICADDLKESAMEWAAYRIAHGRRPAIATLAEVAQRAKVETAGLVEIKNYIEWQAKDNPDLQVLLIGDCPNRDAESHDPKTEIPWFLTRQEDCGTDPKRRSRVPTDNFFADIKLDDDGLPEIAVGRIPARTNEQVRLALRKVQVYESAPQGEWLRNLTFFAGEGRFGKLVDGMLESLFTRFAENTISSAYTVRMTYANVNSSYAYIPRMFSDKVVEEANAGSLMLVYMGHGSYDRLDNMHVGRTRYPILLGDDVKKFNIPDGKLPVMLIVACQTGYMDHPEGSLCERVCFQEKAPVAVIASSRDSHPYSNTLLQKAMVSEITKHRRATLGEAFLRAKRELILAEDPERVELETLATLVIPKKADRAALNQAHVSLYNLTGDPALQMRYPRIDMTPGDARTNAGTLSFAATLPDSIDATKLQWEFTIESRRSQIPGQLKTVTAADLTSADAKLVKAAEDAIAANHATSNNKQVAALKAEPIGTATEGAKTKEQHFEGKPDPALAPGEYILKLSARDKEGNYGFTAVRLTVEK